jgi:hypothetical protein
MPAQTGALMYNDEPPDKPQDETYEGDTDQWMKRYR